MKDNRVIIPFDNMADIQEDTSPAVICREIPVWIPLDGKLPIIEAR